ncbi:hypothetical protein PInf_005234 [Phytophthora infestans]|nr:hypothetical protein PInf_005234 [Phytophthora infestans]
MLEAGKQVKATNKISRELQFIQMTGWMQQGKSMGDVIKLLKLGGGMDKLLVNPNLPILETYIHVFNKFNAGRQTSVIKELMGFHTEKVVSTALQAAKKSPETNAIATKLQAAQFRYWFDNKVKPPKIFGMLDMKKSTVQCQTSLPQPKTLAIPVLPIQPTILRVSMHVLHPGVPVCNALTCERRAEDTKDCMKDDIGGGRSARLTWTLVLKTHKKKF